MQVVSKACPLFVPLVEEGWLKDPITMEVARRYLEELLQYDIDTLILGCTHYPLLRSTVQKIVGDKVNLVNPAYETSQALKRMLEELGLENDTHCPAGEKYQFYASDTVEKFNALDASCCSVLVVKGRGAFLVRSPFFTSSTSQEAPSKSFKI